MPERPPFKTSGLTHSQLQIWIGQKLSPGSPLYNMAFAFLLRGELDTEVFQRAWRKVVQESDALRTRVEEHGGSASRGLHPPEACGTNVLDRTGAADPELGFERWCEERCSRPLPLDGELVDSVLIVLGEGLTGWYLNQHHLITDATSTLLLYRQVAAEYRALMGGGGATAGEAGMEIGVPELFPYYPTADSLRTDDSKAKRAAQDHWAARTDGDSRSVRLYGCRTEGAEDRNTRLTLELDEARSRALDRLAEDEGFRSFSPDLSRFAVFATLVASWLSRVGGQAGVGFDAPVAGRPSARAKQSIGLFIEMFPFRANVEPADSFRSLGARCLGEAQQFLRHSLPGTSTPSSGASSNVVLNFFAGSFGDFAGLPAAVRWVHSGFADRGHALRLQIHDFAGRGGYTLHFDCNDDALPAPYRQRAMRHFELLLDACGADPDCAIATVPLITEEEAGMLRMINDTGSAPLPTRSVVELFESQVRSEPERVALRQGNREVSFEELNQEAEALSSSLLQSGVQPEDRVAILAKRSIDTVVAILGTLKARGAYVPVDPSYPEARIRHILQDCGAKVLLADTVLEVQLPEVVPREDRSSEGRPGEGERPLPLGAVEEFQEGMPILAISETIRAGRALEPVSPGLGKPALGELAYMIYTSGSTGLPKGVLVEHAGLADYLDWASRQYVRGDRLTFPLFTSLSFDLTVTSLFLPLITGCALEIYPEPEGPVDSSLLDVAAANSVDFIKLTPSHLSLLRQFDLAPSRTGSSSANGSMIRRMVVGGEELKTKLAHSIMQSISPSVGSQEGDQLELYNEYGPTEAVVGCIAHRYDPLHDVGASVPIGTPADHVEIEILNEAGAPVPLGVPGELWISRYGLARGYHGREGLTSERFEPHPDRPKELRYRTGDLVRLEESGPENKPSLKYLGRVDRQLKISGLRVEPGEIEATLLSHPAVRQCVVVARRRAPIRSEAETAIGEIRYCRRCGLPSNYPRATFDQQGVCNVCRAYDSVKERAGAYFKSEEDLHELFEQSRSQRAGSAVASSEDRARLYDCMLLLSGGKDSSYALCRLVEMGLKVLAFTLDNGYISEGAKDNMKRVTEQLGVPLELASTPAMNDIFRDSLERYSNVCHGCFKTIYTLSANRALELDIPIIVTGLSRGQMFETRLTEELFRDDRFSVKEVEAAVLAARRVYHRVNDEVFRSLDVRAFQDDAVFEQIQFVDFYRYCDVGLDEVLSYLAERVPWVRPEDTGRSTNCLINDIGIYVHKKERSFHNYAMPYSWDVRLGHKTRQQALAELDDELDLDHVHRTLFEIGYEADRGSEGGMSVVLEAFFVAEPSGSGVGATGAELREYLAEQLPGPLVPAAVREIDAIPLTPNGKVDEGALPLPSVPDATIYVAPQGPVEEYLVELWRNELGVERVGTQDDFFQLGGTSLGAMEVMVRLCQEFDIDLELEALFQLPTVRQLAGLAERTILEDVSGMTVAEQRELLGEA